MSLTTSLFPVLYLHTKTNARETSKERKTLNAPLNLSVYLDICSLQYPKQITKTTICIYNKGTIYNELSVRCRHALSFWSNKKETAVLQSIVLIFFQSSFEINAAGFKSALCGMWGRFVADEGYLGHTDPYHPATCVRGSSNQGQRSGG